MKILKGFAALLAMFVLISALLMPAYAADVYAADTFVYEKEAKKLYAIGLYKGISSSAFNPDLRRPADRETGVVMLVKLLGTDLQTVNYTDEEMAGILSVFRDSSGISSWARKSLAFAVKNGLLTQKAGSLFDPKGSLTGKTYCTWILTNLGYDVTAATFKDTSALLAIGEKAGIKMADVLRFFTDKPVNKDYLVGITYAALTVKDVKGVSIACKLAANDAAAVEKLVEAEIIDSIQAEEMTYEIEAERAVAEYESAAYDTIDDITAAGELQADVEIKVGYVTDETVKADLEKRIADQKAKIDARKTELFTDSF